MSMVRSSARRLMLILLRGSSREILVSSCTRITSSTTEPLQIPRPISALTIRTFDGSVRLQVSIIHFSDSFRVFVSSVLGHDIGDVLCRLSNKPFEILTGFTLLLVVPSVALPT